MLHKPSLARIEASAINPDVMKSIFTKLAEAAEELGSESLVLESVFAFENDAYEIGDYVPQILFQVRKITDESN